MSQRRAIACTICAKAKTKCDKAVPSCSRCTAKGLPCEPRSTRRTSDHSSHIRNTKKQMVSPKKYPTTNSIHTISRHSSPRSVPTSNRHQLVRHVSQMDFHTAVKLGQQQSNFAGMPMLTPLSTYPPQIIDEFHSYSSSPEQSMAAFSHSMDNSTYVSSGRLTPRTPEPFGFNEPLSIVDTFDQYTHSQWPEDGQVQFGLGIESDIPGLMPGEPNMRVWTPEFDGNSTPMGSMRHFDTSVCDSPAMMNGWPNQSVSVSPPQPPHTRAVPSLSISECSAQESESPKGAQDEWQNYRGNPGDANNGELSTMAKNPHMWQEAMLTRSSTY